MDMPVITHTLSEQCNTVSHLKWNPQRQRDGAARSMLLSLLLRKRRRVGSELSRTRCTCANMLRIHANETPTNMSSTYITLHTYIHISLKV